jgi:hypothetical protein
VIFDVGMGDVRCGDGRRLMWGWVMFDVGCGMFDVGCSIKKMRIRNSDNK